MAKIVSFSTYGGPEVLEIKDVAVPAPAPGEVRIQVKAIGLNRAESMWRTGVYVEPVKLPARLDYESSGIVDAVGSNVTHVAVGDAVSTVPSFSMNDYGMHGELVLAPRMQSSGTPRRCRSKTPFRSGMSSPRRMRRLWKRAVSPQATRF